MALIPNRGRQLGLGVAAAGALAGVARNYNHIWDGIQNLRSSNIAAQRELDNAIKQGMKRRNTNGRGSSKRARTYPAKPKAKNMRIGGYMGQGLKYYDQSGVTGLTTTSYITNVTPDGIVAPAQGTAATERLGRTFQAVSITADLMIFPGVAAGGALTPIKDMIFTMYLIHDRQTNGSTNVLPSEVFQTNGPPQPFLNMENTDRFRIVCKKEGKLVNYTQNLPDGAVSNTVVGAGTLHMRCYQKLNMKVLMKDTTDGNRNVQDNGLFLMVHANVRAGVAGESAPQVQWQTRARFVG